LGWRACDPEHRDSSYTGAIVLRERAAEVIALALTAICAIVLSIVFHLYATGCLHGVRANRASSDATPTASRAPP
jgi:hypothetical protein